jgi:hypothetical protein
MRRWLASGAALAAVALLLSCCGPRGPLWARPPAGLDAGLRADAAPDPLVDFARAHYAELDRLSPAFNHYLAHEQARPRGFTSFRNRRRAPGHMHHARMIAFNYGGACEEQVVEKDGTICEGAVYPGVALTAAQTERAAEIVRLAAGPAWDARPSISCFEPHHAVVFFDERDAPVAEIDVCFMCGNFKLAPGPESEAGMTDLEGHFFADTCRTLGVGGCPPDGTFRMPDLPPEHASRQSLSAWELQELNRNAALAAQHGVTENLRLSDLTTIDRKLLCAWFGGVRHATGAAFECAADGRLRILVDQEQCMARVPRECQGTVGDFVTCARARLTKMCGPDDVPACRITDACRKGVVLR